MNLPAGLIKSIPNSPIIDVAAAGSPGLVDGEVSSGLKSVCAPVSKSKNSVFVNISKLGSMLNSSCGSETFSCSRTNCDVRFAPRRLKLVAILKEVVVVVVVVEFVSLRI